MTRQRHPTGTAVTKSSEKMETKRGMKPPVGSGRKCVQGPGRLRLAPGFMKISIGVVLQGALGKPLPPFAEVLFYDITVKSRQLECFAIKILPEAGVADKVLPHLPEKAQAAIAFGRYGPHKVHPPRIDIGRGHKPAVKHPRGESVFGEVDDLIIEIHPIIVFRFDVHGQVVVEKVERKGKYTVVLLVFKVQRRCFAKSR